MVSIMPIYTSRNKAAGGEVRDAIRRCLLVQPRQRRRDGTRLRNADMDVVGLQYAANIGPVRGVGEQAPNRRRLVAERFEERE
jgi:hypothetical protein